MRSLFTPFAIAVLLAVALVASPSAALADTAPAQCSAVEEIAVEPAGEILFLTDDDSGGGDPQCSEVSGCGFILKRTFVRNSDDYCATQCPSVCPGDTGYYEEDSGCCICIAV